MNGKFSVCWFFLAAFFVFSCAGKEKDTPPAGLIDKPTMIELLRDVYQTEAKVASLTISYDSSQKVFDLVEEDLLARHGVDDSLYRLSMRYYFNHPDELSYIYEAVVDSLSLQELVRFAGKAQNGFNIRTEFHIQGCFLSLHGITGIYEPFTQPVKAQLFFNVCR
ncbi:MAG: DUF4296 domain-containing protein, partial [Cyclobacteriaceae bacterium]